jgi:hypothetical protein
LRAELGLPEPSPAVEQAIDSLAKLVLAAAPTDGAPAFDALLATAAADPPGEPDLDHAVRRTLLAMLEERRTRQPSVISAP